jgi:peroxiredoxin
VLIVNIASKCILLSQLEELESLFKSTKSANGDGFVILGFPCDQFGDTGKTAEQVQSFCALNHGASFPILEKIDVNGHNASSLYEWMKKEKPGLFGMKRVKWNFEKFLIGKDGRVKQRWAPTAKPKGLQKAIERELQKS